MSERLQPVTIRLSGQERAWLAELVRRREASVRAAGAEDYQLSEAGLVRHLLRDEAQRAGIVLPNHPQVPFQVEYVPPKPTNGASSPDDKGNITAYVTYRHMDPVLQGTRDFSDCGTATFNSRSRRVENSPLANGCGCGMASRNVRISQ